MRAALLLPLAMLVSAPASIQPNPMARGEYPAGANGCICGAKDGSDSKPAPDISPDPAAGSGESKHHAVAALPKAGRTPERKIAVADTREVIEDGMKYLTDEDLNAIAIYLMAQRSGR